MITETSSSVNFEYSETQLHVAESARKFAKQYIEPHIMEWDEAQTFPVEVFKSAGDVMALAHLR